MANGKRIVNDLPLRKCLQVPGACLLRIGEVIREITADEPFAAQAGNLLGGCVDVGDSPFGADSDLGIKAGFYEVA